MEEIKFIQSVYENCGEELFVGFSGGKDSIVLEHLVRRSGVPYKLVYSATGIDPPEIVKFIKEYYPQCEIVKSNKSFFYSITTRNPPLIHARWCCEYLKKLAGSGKHRLLGIRKEESFRRQKYERINKFERYKYTAYYPILEWTAADVWEYIEEYKLPYPSLYDEGFDRLGCVICPYRREKQHKLYKERWPGMFKVFEAAVKKWYNKRVSQGRTMAYDSAEEFLADWYKCKASWYKKR